MAGTIDEARDGAKAFALSSDRWDAPMGSMKTAEDG
jgi:hypothetical protein